MDWIKLTVTTTNEASEAVINLLMENGAGGVEIDDSDLSQVELATYFQAQAGLVELLPELEQKIAQLREFGLDPGKGTVKLAELDDDSWAAVSNACKANLVVGCVPVPKARPGSSLITFSSVDPGV